MSDAQDEVITGAGPNGLASSLLLAQVGLKVKVFEKEDRAGGRTKNHRKGWIQI